MSQYLFICTISPVQSFIAQARKTQDLYAGSRILSELTAEGIRAFGKDNVIFPNPSNDSKPNRFLGKIEKDEKELLALGRSVEDAIKEKFKQLASQALIDAKVNKPNGDKFDKQIENHLEVFWIFEKIKTTYKDAYENIERNLGAIKNVRSFAQMPEQGRKCSVDGERNALFFGRKKPSLAIKEQQDNSVIVRGFALKEKEGLSAVSFLKRFYEDSQEKNKDFPSTAKITLAHAETNLDEKGKVLFQDFKNVFHSKGLFIQACAKYCTKITVSDTDFSSEEWLSDSKHFDYQLLYKENLEKEIQNKNQFDCAKIILDKLEKYFKDTYYALLIFDGDSMGKWLSGEYLTSNNLAQFHTHLSEKLGAFAKNIDTYLKEFHFQTVYAGGDDYLGFVNLHSLFDVLSTLRKEFKKEVSDKLTQDDNNNIFELKTGSELTFSAGIAIAHYKTPLDIVLKTARDMENKAKEEGNRNAFAISVLKHSGESHETVYKFEKDNLAHIQAIVYALQNEEVSKKFITVLAQEIRLLQDDKPDFFQKEIGKNIVLSEIKRSIERAKMPEKNVGNLIESVKSLFSEKTNNFIEAMQIARFINKELKND